jgi:Flp pilus assembly protein TadD
MTTKSRLQQIEAMLEHEPSDPELRYMLAMEHASGGNDAEAVHCFQDLIARSPDYPPAYHQGGRALVRLNRIEEAQAMLKKGIPIALGKNDQHGAGEMQDLLLSLE